ncbi:MAG: PAS domain S-box protein [Gammaproteobacteria bacterium]|nr:PAS domain S-box protein [Gammaproteobacteria bacterium]
MSFSVAALFISATAYLSVLFLIAHASERGWIPAKIVRHPIVYVLSLGVYATSWSYYGSVGFAERSGLAFITIYLGVTLAFALTPILLMPLLRLTRRHQLTSIADLFAFRFNSQFAGVLVTLMILTGSLPYLALQIRAVAESTQVLSDQSPPHTIAIVFCIMVTVFAIIFGARHVTPREKHSGLVAAIAFESVIKIGALVLIALVAVKLAFGELGGLDHWLKENPDKLTHYYSSVSGDSWTGLLFLAFAAAFLLPRQFHMLFTENLHSAGLRTASWAFPLLLLILAAGIPPVLWAGQALQIGGSSDYYVLGIALFSESAVLALLAYLGGISAASAMIIVSTLAISSMCLNHLVLPVVRITPYQDLYATLRWARRVLIAVVIAAGYLFYLSLERTEGLVSWGLISFLAMAQLIPGVIATLFWPAASRNGFIAGLLAGGAIWGAAALLPALSTFGPIHIVGVDLGATQTPTHFATLAFWSVTANALIFVLVSLFSRASVQETEAAEACHDLNTRVPEGGLLANSPNQFIDQLAPVTGASAAGAEIERAMTDLELSWEETRPEYLQQLREQVQRNLSGMMGPMLARDIVDQCLRLDTDTHTALSQNVRLIEERLERHRKGFYGIAGELDALRRYHRQILEDLPLGVVAITPNDRISRWNPAMEQLTGTSAPRILGRQVSELQPPWADLLAEFAHEDAAHAYKRHIRLTTGDCWLSLHKTLISGDDRSSEGDRLLLIEDVTDVNRLENELTHSERLASIGRLAAGVAHEIGNPITAIACLAQELRDAADQPEAQQILEQTDRINHIVQTLIGYAHAGTTPEPRQARPVALAPVIQEAQRVLQLNPSARHIQFEAAVDPTLKVFAEHQRLVQVFVNLLSNAVDACTSEDSEQGNVSITAKVSRDRVEVHVIDNGQGIPPAIADKVLEPFFTTKPPGLGTGLGLALAYSIVQDYEGSLSLQARRGKATGTEVVLRLIRATEADG